MSGIQSDEEQATRRCSLYENCTECLWISLGSCYGICGVACDQIREAPSMIEILHRFCCLLSVFPMFFCGECLCCLCHRYIDYPRRDVCCNCTPRFEVQAKFSGWIFAILFLFLTLLGILQSIIFFSISTSLSILDALYGLFFFGSSVILWTGCFLAKKIKNQEEIPFEITTLKQPGRIRSFIFGLFYSIPFFAFLPTQVNLAGKLVLVLNAIAGFLFGGFIGSMFARGKEALTQRAGMMEGPFEPFELPLLDPLRVENTFIPVIFVHICSGVVGVCLGGIATSGLSPTFWIYGCPTFLNLCFVVVWVYKVFSINKQAQNLLANVENI